MRDVIPLFTLDDCLEKQKFGNFDVLKSPSEAGHLITSETDSPLLTGISCNYGTVCYDVSIFLLFSSDTLRILVEVSLGSSSRSGVNQVYLRSVLSGSPLCEMSCTRSVQLGGIMPSLINGAVENSSYNTTIILGNT